MKYKVIHKAPPFRMEAASHYHECEYGCEWLCLAPLPCDGVHPDCPDVRAIRESDRDRKGGR